MTDRPLPTKGRQPMTGIPSEIQWIVLPLMVKDSHDAKLWEMIDGEEKSLREYLDDGYQIIHTSQYEDSEAFYATFVLYKPADFFSQEDNS